MVWKEVQEVWQETGHPEIHLAMVSKIPLVIGCVGAAATTVMVVVHQGCRCLQAAFQLRYLQQVKRGMIDNGMKLRKTENHERKKEGYKRLQGIWHGQGQRTVPVFRSRGRTTRVFQLLFHYLEPLHATKCKKMYTWFQTTFFIAILKPFSNWGISDFWMGIVCYTCS